MKIDLDELRYSSKNDVWHVNMIIGGQLIECRPMVSDVTVHSLRYAEDAAENWCIGIIE